MPEERKVTVRTVARTDGEAFCSVQCEHLVRPAHGVCGVFGELRVEPQRRCRRHPGCWAGERQHAADAEEAGRAASVTGRRLPPLPRVPGRLVDREEVLRELVRVVTEDFPTRKVDERGNESGHVVEAITSTVIRRALERVAAMPAAPEREAGPADQGMRLRLPAKGDPLRTVEVDLSGLGPAATFADVCAAVERQGGDPSCCMAPSERGAKAKDDKVGEGGAGTVPRRRRGGRGAAAGE